MLDLSFRIAGHTSWGTMRRLLSSTFHEGLEALRLRFPQKPDGRPLGIMDRAWRDCVVRAHSLQELELDNHIPSTVTALCENGRVYWSMEKRVLSRDFLPSSFAELFTPESLPNLEYLDPSRAYWHVDTPLEEQQEWMDKWLKVGISAFMPPRASADG